MKTNDSSKMYTNSDFVEKEQPELNQDAQAYCNWLTGQDGTNTYRLPSESEWELAAGHR